MNEEKVKNLIDKVTTQTVVKLIKNDKNTTFKKTEEILKNYNQYKKAIDNNVDNTVKTKKLVTIVESALKSIDDDPYYEIIQMFYFDRMSRECVADYFNCDVKTITRNKKRLVDMIKIILFSDDTIEELFS